MGKWTQILTAFIFFFTGCKFTSSPYESASIDLKQNNIFLQKIQSNEASDPPDFKIAFISDTHNYYDELEELVNTINARGPYSFVVVTGDITNQGLFEEYQKTKQYLQNLNFPYVVVVGNHDLLSNGMRVYESLFGKTDFQLIYQDVHFVFFNNNNWEAGGQVPNWSFVDSVLSSSTSPHKILVSHVSPDDIDRFTPQEISKWETMMSTHGVDYYLHGHDHNYAQTLFGPATRVTIGAPSKRVYVELIFNAGGVTHQKVDF